MSSAAKPHILSFLFLGLFSGNTGFDQDVSGWDTSSVLTMDYMFESAVSFTGTGVNSWDVSSVVEFDSM